MKKADLLKELGLLYKPPSNHPILVEVPRMSYLMVDGKGNPNTSLEYRDAIQALFSTSYTLKFMVKRGAEAIDYKVMPLEGLWWADDMESFGAGRKDEWRWTSMMVQPVFISAGMVEEAKAKQKGKGLPALSKVRLEAMEEGLSAQILHIGPFSEEGPTIRKLHDFISSGGKTMRGKHHEIYLSDIRKTASEKLKTIIRQPIG